ncbi:MAG: ABC transporter permease, partial [Candidatus Eremiobacterota bacterium]
MDDKKPIIVLTDIYKTYVMGDTKVNANDNINLTLYKGEFVVIMGASGSGKSTVMNLIGCLDRPTSGSYKLDGVEVSQLDDDELSVIRNQKIGFVFQKFHLLSGMTARENVELPMIYAGVSTNERMHVAANNLTKVGLETRMNHVPNELSGGQMQRVAIARAISNKPPILLADEPTGALDSRSGDEIMALFQELHRKGSTVILITHNPEVAKYGTRVVKLHDGKVTSDEQVKEEDRILLASDIKTSMTVRLNMRGSMNIMQSVKIAWNALKANKMRSLLTMLGIIIGISSVIIMTAIGNGMDKGFRKQFTDMGVQNVIVSPGKGDSVIQSSIGSKTRQLTMRDITVLKNQCFSVKGVAPSITTSVTAVYGSNNMDVTIKGTSPEILVVDTLPVAKGRFFTQKDCDKNSPVCVIGNEVAEKLFGKDLETLGNTIKMVSKSSSSSSSNSSSSGNSDPNSVTNSGIRLKVIGVLKKKDRAIMDDYDKTIITPITTFKSRVYYQSYLSFIQVASENLDTVKKTKDEVTRVLLPIHDNNIKNLDILSFEQQLAQSMSTIMALSLFLSIIAVISLVVGGIGIMNIMLVSVTERTKEIGLRKAIGARKGDISTQFLIESLVLSITGGIIGILVGTGISAVYPLLIASSSLKDLMGQAIISFTSIVVSFGFSAMVGVFFGLYPA